MNTANIALFEGDPSQQAKITECLYGTAFRLDERAFAATSSDALDLIPSFRRWSIDLVILDVNISKKRAKTFHVAEVIMRSLNNSGYAGAALGIYDDEHFWQHNVRVSYQMARRDLDSLPWVIREQIHIPEA